MRDTRIRTIELATIHNKVFGKKNHITTFCWKKRSSASNQSKFTTQEHEYIIAVAKDIKKAKWNGIPQFEPKDNDSVPLVCQKATFLANGGRINQQCPLYHGADPNDITTELKKTGNKITSHRESMIYPLYHGADPNDRIKKFNETGCANTGAPE